MQYDENAEKYGYDGEMTPMKCDELKPLMCAHEPNVRPMYDKSEVDAAIAELKDAWRSEHEACEALKKKLENVQASMYCDVVDANMENRRMKRALWLARAERAKTEHLSKIMYSALFRDFIAKWVNVERKCRAKAESYL